MCFPMENPLNNPGKFFDTEGNLLKNIDMFDDSLILEFC